MDEINYINSQVRRKSGFVLMITLSVLSVVIVLTTILLGYFEEVQEDVSDTKALIQADIYYTNITDIFNKFKDKKMLFNTLFKTSLPIVSEEDKFGVILDCKPTNEGININWFALDGDDKNSHLYDLSIEVFEHIAGNYKISDASRLQEMLLEVINGQYSTDRDFRERLGRKGGIKSYREFSDIVTAYQFEEDDKDIGLVPWEKYFSFTPKSENITTEYSSAELISFLFDIELSSILEWKNSIELDRPPLSSMISDNGGDYNSRKNIISDNPDTAKCSVNYSFDGDYYRFSFEYIEGEAKYFEFYGKK